MTLVIMLVLLGLAVGLLVRAELARRRPLTGAELLRRAELRLEAERRRTRQAMNEAAGQAWRNMVE